MTDDLDDVQRAFLASTAACHVPVAFSDLALAEQFVYRYGDDWRYVSTWAKWMHWNQSRWKADETLAIAEQTSAMCIELVNSDSADQLSPTQQKSLCSVGTSRNTITATSHHRTIASTVDQWDTDPWLLSTPGGVVDLRTGTLRPATREDYMRKCTAVTPADECPLWLTFLDQVTAGDVELQSYLARLAGYCLTGVVTEQMFAFFYGTGGNGKGVFLRALLAVMGDYGLNAPMEMFMETKNPQHPTELARLHGARCVTAQEIDEGRKWAESRIKALTGRDTITARFMNQDHFDFQPTHKILFAGNHKPALSSVDEAMRRRVHIVPFTITIDAEHRDLNLDDKLSAEHAGILQWMIHGCLDWQYQGLNPPEAVTKATDEYMQAEDALQEWMDENCHLGDAHETSQTDLYRDYVDFCESGKEHAWSKKRLVNNLVGRGLHAVKEYGLRTIKGIGLKHQPEQSKW